MPNYYPLSQIQTNLYTNGGEYVVKSTGNSYTGFYYKVSTGKLYVGKLPEGAQVELVPTPTTDPTLPQPSTLQTPPITLVTDQPKYPDPYTDFDTAVYEDNLDTSFENRSLPSPYYQKPTIEDFSVGEYRRYFAKKTNELIYIEISKEAYTKFKSNDPTVASDLYECLFLPWSITNPSSLILDTTNPKTINKKIVSQVERNNKWYGFTSYFRGNFG